MESLIGLTGLNVESLSAKQAECMANRVQNQPVSRICFPPGPPPNSLSAWQVEYQINRLRKRTRRIQTKVVPRVLEVSCEVRVTDLN